MITQFFIVGVGSAAGGMCRYAVGRWIGAAHAGGFPLATLIVNLLGCFMIGLFYGLFDRWSAGSSAARLLLTTGFCGGFTTFSTFAAEGMTLLSDGSQAAAALYIGVSVAGGLALAFAGAWLARVVG